MAVLTIDDIQTAFIDVDGSHIQLLKDSFPTLRFGFKPDYRGSNDDEPKQLLYVTDSNGTLRMSSVEFSFSNADPPQIHIEHSLTPHPFRRLQLNTILRVVLCLIAGSLKCRITSQAINQLTVHSLCELGFTPDNHLNICDAYEKLPETIAISNKSIEVWMTKTPLTSDDGVDSKVMVVYERIIRSATELNEKIKQRVSNHEGDHKFADDMLKIITEDALVSGIVNDVDDLEYADYKVGVVMDSEFFKIYISTLVIDYEERRNLDEPYFPIAFIPFKMTDKNSIDVPSSFNIGNLRGGYPYQTLLCILSNVCLGLKMSLHLDVESKTNPKIIQTLTNLGFENITPPNSPARISPETNATWNLKRTQTFTKDDLESMGIYPGGWRGNNDKPPWDPNFTKEGSLNNDLGRVPTVTERSLLRAYGPQRGGSDSEGSTVFGTVACLLVLLGASVAGSLS